MKTEKYLPGDICEIKIIHKNRVIGYANAISYEITKGNPGVTGNIIFKSIEEGILEVKEFNVIMRHLDEKSNSLYLEIGEVRLDKDMPLSDVAKYCMATIEDGTVVDSHTYPVQIPYSFVAKYVIPWMTEEQYLDAFGKLIKELAPKSDTAFPTLREFLC